MRPERTFTLSGRSTFTHVITDLRFHATAALRRFAPSPRASAFARFGHGGSAGGNGVGTGLARIRASIPHEMYEGRRYYRGTRELRAKKQPVHRRYAEADAPDGPARLEPPSTSRPTVSHAFCASRARCLDSLTAQQHSRTKARGPAEQKHGYHCNHPWNSACVV